MGTSQSPAAAAVNQRSTHLHALHVVRCPGRYLTHPANNPTGAVSTPNRNKVHMEYNGKENVSYPKATLEVQGGQDLNLWQP